MSNTHRNHSTTDQPTCEAEDAESASPLAEQLAATLTASATGLRFNIAQDTFQEAYASLLDAVPRDDRPALLAQMRRDLDIVAERELSLASGSDTQAGHVSTRQFMRGLEEQERQQREKDVASHSLLSGPELRTRLAVTPQALSAALKARRLFALRGEGTAGQSGLSAHCGVSSWGPLPPLSGGGLGRGRSAAGAQRQALL